MCEEKEEAGFKENHLCKVCKVFIVIKQEPVALDTITIY